MRTGPLPRGREAKAVNEPVLEQVERFALVVRPDPQSQVTAERLRVLLTRCGCREDARDPDAVIVVGGDGTFLYAVHLYLNDLARVTFIGVHTGTLGFFMDYQDNNIEEFVTDLLQGHLPIEVYPMLQAETGERTLYAMNEVRLENPIRTQRIRVRLDGDQFEDYRGTGLCVCTQLGSSALNRSLGGALLQKGLHAFELTEIAGLHHRAYRSLGAPFVMSDDTCIEFESDNYSGAILGADSDFLQMSGPGCIRIFKSKQKRIHILRGKKVTYFQRLERLF